MVFFTYQGEEEIGLRNLTFIYILDHGHWTQNSAHAE